MTPPKATQQQELIDAISRLSFLLETFGDSTNEKLRLIDMRITAIDQSVEKINKSLYGNGVPGIDELLRDLARRMEGVEQQQETCPIVSVASELEEIRRLHEVEEGLREKERAAREKARAETRRYLYGIITLILTVIGDIAMRWFGK